MLTYCIIIGAKIPPRASLGRNDILGRCFVYSGVFSHVDCERAARGNPFPQNLSVLIILPIKAQHFGERIATR